MSLALASFVSTGQADLEPGRELRRAGKLEEAMVFFQQALAGEPTSPEVQRELGHCLVLAGRYREAIDTFQNLAAVQDVQWQLEAAKWTGLAHLYLGNVEASLEQSELEGRLAAQLGEASAKARAARRVGYIHSELGQFGQANSAFVTALNEDPNDLDTLYLVGVLAARQGDWGSLRYQVLDLEPIAMRSRNPDATSRIDHLKAELALARGDGEEALTLLEKTTGSMSLLYREARARAYRHQDDLARAEATYLSIVDSTDERLEFPLIYVKALRGMAEVLDAQERRDEAASLYRRFLEHRGDGGDPLPGVADARRRLQELEAQP